MIPTLKTLTPKTLTPKGEARRAALMDAVLRVLELHGPGGVTHRAVAAEAGVPLAAATYYFATIDDLLVSALTRATDEQVDLLAALDTPDIAAFARHLHTYTHTHRASAIAQYELLFLAMRRDSLRPAADVWYQALEKAVRATGLDGQAAAVAALAIDGLLVRMLWHGDPSSVPEIESMLRSILNR